ncbi:unnamed protein product, partial [Scytosiphon promiscuus]
SNVDGQQLNTSSVSGGASSHVGRKSTTKSEADKAEEHENENDEKHEGGVSDVPSGDAGLTSPVLPRARVVWRAFSEVNHGKIEDNHRRAAQRHFARFSLTPAFENPPVCYSPFES